MNDMKCPFCQQELNSFAGTVDCTNFDCIKTRGWYGNKELWQELVRTRKALDVAVDALKYANKCIKGGCVNWETEIDKALAKITALEQKDVK